MTKKISDAPAVPFILALIHFMVFMFAAPFWGGFLISFAKYRLETDFTLVKAFSCAIVAGLFGIYFYAFWGFFCATFTVPLLWWKWSNLIANLTMSYFFLNLVMEQSPGFFAGYEYLMTIGVFVFGLANCLLFYFLKRLLLNFQ